MWPTKEQMDSQVNRAFLLGLCRPSRGDLGEIVAAAYLLFCGDVLRYRVDCKLETFSVPADCWARLLKNPDCKPSPEKDVPVSVNFLQFCRNDLGFGLRHVWNENFLRYMYERCCAFYADEGCPLYGAYASIRCWDNERKDHFYVPLLISIKTRTDYTHAQATTDNNLIIKGLFNIGQERALVLAVLLNREASGGHRSDDSTSTNSMTDRNLRSKSKRMLQHVSQESRGHDPGVCNRKIVSEIIAIPTEDPFGLTSVARDVTQSQ